MTRKFLSIVVAGLLVAACSTDQETASQSGGAGSTVRGEPTRDIVGLYERCFRNSRSARSSSPKLAIVFSSGLINMT